MKENRPQCATCAKPPVCGKCSRPIDGKYVMQGASAFHAACIQLKGCAKCESFVGDTQTNTCNFVDNLIFSKTGGGELTSEIVTAGDQRFHPRNYITFFLFFVLILLFKK